jgi:ribosome-interacting GTPase 1
MNQIEQRIKEVKAELSEEIRKPKGKRKPETIKLLRAKIKTLRSWLSAYQY